MGNCIKKTASPEKPFTPDKNADTPESLSAITYFSINEVEALYSLFSQVSNTLVKDGLIHAEEFQLALFGSAKQNVFANRVFQLFDQKSNQVIEFGEFVRALSVFHPSADLKAKSEFAFRVYDLGNTGCIEKSEVRQMLVAIITDNPSLKIPEEALEQLLEKTFKEVDLAGDGKISLEEWHHLTTRNPTVLSNMTLEPLRTLTVQYPSFIFNK
eukprot:CAMPEP_0196600932 /NCGR_PEP_ID=MMETSP1081-20130531/95644_1 /TAXON_ID=36882 /ORGANISM="Pyramimonas amylifera, Strain CCMP720" /LENGTH=212 /DNA_ID=CAMNT_0041926787 /DNA_START=55 /DNA_END=693 /DNA_ORIENTATION=+